jgi:hypothetical protein
MRVFGTPEHFLYPSATASVSPDREPYERVTGEDGIADRLAVARPRPELRLVLYARDDPSHQPGQDHHQRVIKPDDRIGTRPDEIAHRRVAAVNDPCVASDG